MGKGTLYIYIDESGDLTPLSHGSKFFIFTLVWTRNPEPLARKMTHLRFSLLKEGYDIEGFHASSDPKPRRKAFFEALQNAHEMSIGYTIVEKKSLNPKIIQKTSRFYTDFLGEACKYLFFYHVDEQPSKVCFFTDKLPQKRLRKPLQKAIKKAISNMSFRYFIYHHHRLSNVWLQIVDYCSWACFRKYEHNDESSFAYIEHLIAFKKEHMT